MTKVNMAFTFRFYFRSNLLFDFRPGGAFGAIYGPLPCVSIGVRDGTSGTSEASLGVGLKMASDSKPVGGKSEKKIEIKKTFRKKGEK